MKLLLFCLFFSSVALGGENSRELVVAPSKPLAKVNCITQSGGHLMEFQTSDKVQIFKNKEIALRYEIYKERNGSFSLIGTCDNLIIKYAENE